MVTVSEVPDGFGGANVTIIISAEGAKYIAEVMEMQFHDHSAKELAEAIRVVTDRITEEKNDGHR